jgi:hypothetical protein
MGMIRKKIINPERVRRINGSFSFIPHRFLTDGFLTSLTQQEILLYIFLVLVSDRHGLSYYAYDSICSYLQLAIDDYIEARDGLIKKDLIASNGTLFQVLDLPAKPANQPIGKATHSAIAQLIGKSLKENDNDR